MAVLKPYVSYRPTGIPWLGEVPEHWKSFQAALASVRRNSRISLFKKKPYYH